MCDWRQWRPNGDCWWWPCCRCHSFRRHRIRRGRRVPRFKRRSSWLRLLLIRSTTITLTGCLATWASWCRRRRPTPRPTTATATATAKAKTITSPTRTSTKAIICRRWRRARRRPVTTSWTTNVSRPTSVCWWCCRAVWFWWWDWSAIASYLSSFGTIATCAIRPICSCWIWAWPTSSSFASACPPSWSRSTSDETPGSLAKSCVSAFSFPFFFFLFLAFRCVTSI